jgi:mRNA interferase MazF
MRFPHDPNRRSSCRRCWPGPVTGRDPRHGPAASTPDSIRRASRCAGRSSSTRGSSASGGLAPSGGGCRVVTPATGEVVLVPFPFSDLSQSKVRPAVCLAAAGRGDWILCQITSNPYGDPAAVTLDAQDFASGSLLVSSFARPGKLFTAHAGLMVRSVGVLTRVAFARVLSAVLAILQSAATP